MRRLLLFFVGCLLACTGMVAEPPMFGVKGSIDVPMPGKWHNSQGAFRMYNSGYGFSLGGVCNVYLAEGFYFEPGVSLYYEGYGYNDLLVTNANGELVDCDPKLWKAGVRVPAVVGWAVNISEKFSLCVFTGPELDYAFAGNNTYRNKELFEGMPPLFDEMRRVSLGWRAGVGFPISNFMVSLETTFGLTDLNKNPNIRYRENRIAGTLTYYF